MKQSNNVPEQVISFISMFPNEEINTSTQNILIKKEVHVISLIDLINCAEHIDTHNLPHELFVICLSDVLYPVATFWPDSDSETRIAFNPIEGNIISYSTDTGLICVSKVDTADLAFFIIDNFEDHHIINILFRDLAIRKYKINERYEIVPFDINY